MGFYLVKFRNGIIKTEGTTEKEAIKKAIVIAKEKEYKNLNVQRVRKLADDEYER